MAPHLWRVEWKCATTIHIGQSAMISGMNWMQKSSVLNWDIRTLPQVVSNTFFLQYWCFITMVLIYVYSSIYESKQQCFLKVMQLFYGANNTLWYIQGGLHS